MRKQEILDARCFCDGSGREPTVGDDESKDAVKWPEEGVVKLPEGQEYDGEWKQGKQHGSGTSSDGQGGKRAGLWEDGERVKWVDE